MPRRQLPQSELNICRRLRAFREGLGLSREAVAETTGIGEERLATYERGRTRVNWGAYKAFANRYGLNPHWFALGRGLPRAPFNQGFLGISASDQSAFSAVFTEHSTRAEIASTVEDEREAQALARAATELREQLDTLKDKDESQRAAIFANPQFAAAFSDLVWSTQRTAEEVGIPVSAPVISESEDFALQHTAKLYSVPHMPSAIPDLDGLIERVNARVKSQGSRRELIAAMRKAELKVSPQLLTNWLRGHNNPDAKTTLFLLSWVQEGEQ